MSKSGKAGSPKAAAAPKAAKEEMKGKSLVDSLREIRQRKDPLAAQMPKVAPEPKKK